MSGLLIFIIYVANFVGAFFVVRFIVSRMTARADFTSLKTVTFGDESAVRPNRAASVISVVTIYLIWGAFTGSSYVPIHAPGPFVGDTSFTYTASDGSQSDDGTVHVRVFKVGEEVEDIAAEPGDGFAKDDSANIGAWRSGLIRVDKNDELGRDAGMVITAVDGQPIEPGGEVRVADGTVTMTPKGTLSFAPTTGWQMEPIWLPSPEAVVARTFSMASEGYQNFTLWEHLGYSLFRVIVGFFFGALVGIPLGYAMGLSDWFRGWFDPIVEFMRPVPPLALIPLVIIWAGIGEVGKIILLFLACLVDHDHRCQSRCIRRSDITKVHAAYSLGASKAQVLCAMLLSQIHCRRSSPVRASPWASVGARSSRQNSSPLKRVPV